MRFHWVVLYSIKGAMSVRKKYCPDEVSAEKFAERWRNSNSTGEYTAKVEKEAY